MLILMFSKNFVINGNNFCSTDCTKKTFMLTYNIYEPDKFELFMMVDTAKFYTLIITLVNMILILGHRGVRKQLFVGYLLA